MHLVTSTRDLSSPAPHPMNLLISLEMGTCLRNPEFTFVRFFGFLPITRTDFDLSPLSVLFRDLRNFPPGHLL